MNAPERPPHADALALIGAALPHDSAALHVRGAARYTDDLPEPHGTLHVALGVSPVAHGRLQRVDLSRVRAAPGVVDVIVAADIPGINDAGPIEHDDPILADGRVQFAGQPVFAVAAHDVRTARRAAALAALDIAPLPAVLDIAAAREAEAWVLPPVHVQRGDAERALAGAPHRLRGTARSGGQDHFYLEGQVTLALPGEGATLHLHVSTQHPGEVQLMVSRALGIDLADVTVACRRMGGGFGGKETQMCQFACIAAVLARRTGRAVKLRLDRDTDMRATGKRHAFEYAYDVGFDDRGRILGLDLTLASRCGFSADLSGPVNDRAVFHADNAYFLGDVALHSYRCRTHTVSDTAFRGFGGPQGMFAIELVLDDIARMLGLDPLDVRRANLYGVEDRNVTPYGMRVEDNIAHELIGQLEERAQYRARRRALTDWNRASPIVKRGIALTPVKFGISFTATHYNQAGAVVHAYRDGTVLLNHGGTEMGQGLYVKVQQVVAHELGLPLAAVRVSGADTSKVANASPTAASSGADLNGMAAQRAAHALRERLARFAADRFGCALDAVTFAAGEVRAGSGVLSFGELTRLAYFARVPLTATGFYATPKVHYDPKTLSGRPFFYFAYGAAVSEVAIDTLTGESRLVRVDILHDAGRSLNPAVDRGQVEGGFLQGVGWLTSEELRWNPAGQLATHAPSTYKIPTAGDWPAHANVRLLENDNVEDTIGRSKAVGEPPLMLAMSAFFALRDAVAACGAANVKPPLVAPATPESILRAVTEVRAPARRREEEAAE